MSIVHHHKVPTRTEVIWHSACYFVRPSHQPWRTSTWSPCCLLVFTKDYLAGWNEAGESLRWIWIVQFTVPYPYDERMIRFHIQSPLFWHVLVTLSLCRLCAEHLRTDAMQQSLPDRVKTVLVAVSSGYCSWAPFWKELSWFSDFWIGILILDPVFSSWVLWTSLGIKFKSKPDHQWDYSFPVRSWEQVSLTCLEWVHACSFQTSLLEIVMSLRKNHTWVLTIRPLVHVVIATLCL